MSKHFTYGEFRELWKKLSERDKNALFYDSLFDYSSFEEDENLEVAFLQKRSDHMKQLIKKCDLGFYNRHIKSSKGEFEKYIGTDILSRYILFYELKIKHIKIKDISKSFPDLLTLGGEYIEVKRLLTSNNLRDVIKDEIINKLKSINGKLIVVLIFPYLDGDPKRAEDLVHGYYIIEDYLNNIVVGKKCCVVVAYQRRYSGLNRLISGIIAKLEQ